MSKWDAELKKYKRILCLDFDGVIHSYESGWKGATEIPDAPVEGAFEFIDSALEEFRVCIYSARSGQKGGTKAMQKWFKRNKYKNLELLSFPSSKPPAFVSIDDRCILFKGKFPTVKSLSEFKPWHNKEV